MKPNDWIMSGDVGISSKTIWAVMQGCKSPQWASPPLDPSDFGRCYRMLVLFPKWRKRLSEVAARHKDWGPMIREWDHLTDLFIEESHSTTGMAPKLYARMQELLKEGRA